MADRHNTGSSTNALKHSEENLRFLAEAVALRDSFIAAASHELKTPVTSLKLYAQGLKRQLDKRGEIELSQYLAKIDEQINQLTFLVNNLLNVSKLKHGKLEFDMEKFDFHELLQDTVEAIQATTTKHHLKVEGQTRRKIYADRYRIYQVLTNLLNNAIKFSPKGGDILVRLSPGPDSVQVSIQDFGIGIEKAQQKKVFSQFYRVDESGRKKYPGFGMGLYISYEIIKRHHGRMSVTSLKGQGSTFSIVLPYRQPTSPGS